MKAVSYQSLLRQELGENLCCASSSYPKYKSVHIQVFGFFFIILFTLTSDYEEDKANFATCKPEQQHPPWGY